MFFILFACITALTFLFMEFVAWAAHKYIMHGLLWGWHRDHHQKEAGFFEKNDRFFLIFAIPSITAFITGKIIALPLLFAVGLGILLYGICYFLVHDVFIHRRFKWFNKSDNRYFRALRNAHRAHHANIHKHGATSFGMLVVPWRYFESK